MLQLMEKETKKEIPAASIAVFQFVCNQSKIQNKWEKIRVIIGRYTLWFGWMDG